MSPYITAKLLIVLAYLGLITANANRIRHRELNQLRKPAISASNCPLTQSWTHQGELEGFPLATFSSYCTALALNTTDPFNPTMIAIDIRSGNVEWSLNITGTVNTFQNFVLASTLYGERYYLMQTKSDYASSLFFEVASYDLRATTAIWQYSWCYPFSVVDGENAVMYMLAFPFRDREVVLVVNGILDTPAGSNYSIIAIDGLTGAILSKMDNLDLGTAVFEQRGNPSEGFFVAKTITNHSSVLYKVNADGAWKVVSPLVQWDARYLPVEDSTILAGIGGLSLIVIAISGPTDWMAIDLHTGDKLWTAASSNCSLLTGSWLTDYPGYQLQSVDWSNHPINPGLSLVTDFAMSAQATIARAGIMDTSTGKLVYMSPVIGPLAGTAIDYQNLWTVADDTKLVMSFNFGNDFKALWFAFSFNLTMMGSGTSGSLEIFTFAHMFFDVVGNSSSVVISSTGTLGDWLGAKRV